MRIRLIHSKTRTWESSPKYRKCADTAYGTGTSFYSSSYESYKRYSQSAVDLARRSNLRVETAMICGIGRSFEEAQLVMELFPTIRKLHVIEWHRPHTDAVAELFSTVLISNNDYDVDIHHADLRNLQTVSEGEVDFAFANKLFDFYFRTEGIDQILANIALTLKRKGILFSFDFPISQMEIRGFNLDAEEVGLTTIKPRLYQKLV